MNQKPAAMEACLKKYIAEVCAIPIDDRLSDNAVVALLNIHLAIMTMTVANHLEHEYGSAKIHRAAMEKLFAIGMKRCRSNQSLYRRAQIIPALFNLFYMPDSILDAHKYALCLDRSFRLADTWRKKAGHGQIADKKGRAIECGVLMAVSSAFTDMASDQEESDCGQLQHRIETWKAEMTADGRWCGLSDLEAAQRLYIMIVNANAAKADSDESLQKSLNFYFRQISKNTTSDAQTLLYLYRAMTERVGISDKNEAAILAKRAHTQVVRYPRGSDEWLWYLATHIGYACAKVNNAIKQSMLV